VDSNPAIYWIIALAVAAAAVVRARLETHRGARRVFSFLGGLEVAVITLLLAALVVLGGLQIVLRNVAGTGILWADPLMRHAVLWLGCLGAALATARLRHINIDVFSRLLSGRFLAARDTIVHAVTAVAAFILAIASLRLVIDERSFGDPAFLGLHTWMLQTVLPFAFLLISYRSIVNLLLRRRATPPGQAEPGAEAGGG
jgi:TRAP-type C4-dicarboxylate transport system permease small subunit